LSRSTIAIAIISLLVALLATAFAYRNVERLTATAKAPVLVKDIPPSTIITREMLVEREVPRALQNEGIYHRPEELVGKVSTVPLKAGRPIYTDQAISLGEFRLTDDPSLEIVSIQVAPEYAVGGVVRPGHFICIYRIAVGHPQETSPQALLEGKGADLEKVTCTVALDVKASLGFPLEEKGERRPLNIITVGVPHEVASELLRLMGEQRTGRYIAAITLGPLFPKEGREP